jgi:four helix bundle protein
MRTYAFEKLEVWQNAREFSVAIYRHTREFPSEEKFGLTAQLRRAAISIASNIAEATGRSSEKDRQHFYRIAYGSLMEVLNQLIIASDLDMLDKEVLNDELRPAVETISSALYTLKGKT